MYAVMNKFIVRQKHHMDFVKETKTVWIKGYRKSKGFVKTMIMQKGDTFVTIDIWKSKSHADKFFAKNLKALEASSWVPKRYTERKSYNMIN